MVECIREVQAVKRKGSWLIWIQIILMVIPVGIARQGMEFSPSFTTAFVTAGVLLTCLGGMAALYAAQDPGRSSDLKGHGGPEKGTGGEKASGPCRVLSASGTALFVLGLACSLPASFIYATGDDFLMQCVTGALLFGAAAGAWLTRRSPSVLRFLLAWFSLAAALFTFLCGLRSPALLPYGIGMLLQSAAFLVLSKRAVAGPALLWAGGMLSALFNIAPAVF